MDAATLLRRGVAKVEPEVVVPEVGQAHVVLGADPLLIDRFQPHMLVERETDGVRNCAGCSSGLRRNDTITGCQGLSTQFVPVAILTPTYNRCRSTWDDSQSDTPKTSA